jgi:hypothetical protein
MPITAAMMRAIAEMMNYMKRVRYGHGYKMYPTYDEFAALCWVL